VQHELTKHELIFHNALWHERYLLLVGEGGGLSGLVTFAELTIFGGSLLSGFISGHSFWTLLSGIATFGGSLLSEVYGKYI